jgi:hypothetical protein
MKIPQAFEQFVRSIYPETPGVADSLESLAAAAIQDSGGNDLRPVLAYLNELLDGGHSHAELQYVWSKQSPRYNFSPGGHRVFFEELRRQIVERQRRPERVVRMSESQSRDETPDVTALIRSALARQIVPLVELADGHLARPARYHDRAMPALRKP